MASFSEANFTKKLIDLNASQQSIQTLSLWLIHHRKHAKTVAETWIRELKKAKPPRMLTFLYLANDVVQNSKKKGPEYGREFRIVLPEAYSFVPKHVPVKTRSSMDRLLTIWRDRAIFDPATLGAMKQFLGCKDELNSTERPKLLVPDDWTLILSTTENPEMEYFEASAGDTPVADTPDTPNEAQSRDPPTGAVGPTRQPNDKRKSRGSKGKEKAKEKPKPAEPPSKKKKKQELSLIEEIEREIETMDELSPPAADKLVKALEDLENSASSDAHVREQIAALPPEVSDVSMLEKLQYKNEAEALATTVESACALLSDYNSRLTAELGERKEVAIMLRAFISAQKEALTAAEGELAEHKAKLQQVSTLRHELQVHIQSLPDMTLLPNVKKLAPLPSAGDLFAIGLELDQ